MQHQHQQLRYLRGIDYGQWNVVNGSNASGADHEYYAFGNPQPIFDPTTNALTSLSVQVVGAAYDPPATNHYLFDQETITVTPSNGFLSNVWWSNYESYSSNGDYSTCNYNWKLGYNITSPERQLRSGVLRPQRLPVRAGLHQRLGVRQEPLARPSGHLSAPSTVTTADPTACSSTAAPG